VKVFNAASGKEVRVIGKAGGPQVGDYDEQRMAHPLGMCVDSNGVLWVAEEDYLPKRISRWTLRPAALSTRGMARLNMVAVGLLIRKTKAAPIIPRLATPAAWDYSNSSRPEDWRVEADGRALSLS